MVGSLGVEAQRRLDLEHVGGVARRLDDHPEFAHALADLRRNLRRRLLGRPVADDVNTEVEPSPVDGSDDVMALGDELQPGLEPATDPHGVALQIVLLEDVEHREADAAGDGTAARR